MQSAQLRREGLNVRAASNMRITVRPLEDKKLAVFLCSFTYQQLRAFSENAPIAHEHADLQQVHETLCSDFCHCTFEIRDAHQYHITTVRVDGLHFQSIQETARGLFQQFNTIPIALFVPITIVSDGADAYIGYLDPLLQEAKYWTMSYERTLASVFVCTNTVGIGGHFYRAPESRPQFSVADICDMHDYFTRGECDVYGMLALQFGKGGRSFEKGIVRMIVAAAGWTGEEVKCPADAKFTQSDFSQLGGLVYVKNRSSFWDRPGPFSDADFEESEDEDEVD